ncbi:MAG: NAD(P)-dependent oxidoreductase [Desulfomicrobium sp.]|nr:NAD(P)-dependent oxidoreductase [Desulfomicrobium sp.]
MKALVIGSAGNLGSAILRSADLDVTGFSRKDWNDQNEFLFKNKDIVIHAAADHSVSMSDNIGNYISSNIGITAYVLEKMKVNKVKKLFYMSSCAVYGDLMCPKETDPMGPVTLNGYMKAANEFIIENFCSTNGIDYHIFRIFNLYGGADRFSFVSKLMSSIQNNRPLLVCNEGMSQRDYIHVNDVAYIVSKLAHHEHCSKYLNIGTGFTTKISEIIKVASESFPSLSVEYIQGPREVEYIRADLTHLKEHIGIYSFKNVLDYIQEKIS